IVSGRRGQNREMRDDEWQRAMDSAVNAKQLNDYLPQQLDNDRAVARRYRSVYPLLFIQGYSHPRVPSYAAADLAYYLDRSKPVQGLLDFNQHEHAAIPS